MIDKYVCQEFVNCIKTCCMQVNYITAACIRIYYHPQTVDHLVMVMFLWLSVFYLSLVSVGRDTLNSQDKMQE